MQITQRRSPFSKTTFTVADQLEVREESLFRTVEAQFALDRIAAKPVQVREFPVPWAIASAVFGVFTLAAMVDGWVTRDMGTAFGFLLVAGCTAACVFNTWQLHKNLFIFRDRHSNQTLFAMLRASPSAGAVDAFVHQLAEAASRLRPRAGSNKHDVVAFHAQVVQQLLDDGVLLKEEHEAIVNRLRDQLAPAPVVRLHASEP